MPSAPQFFPSRDRSIGGLSPPYSLLAGLEGMSTEAFAMAEAEYQKGAWVPLADPRQFEASGQQYGHGMAVGITASWRSRSGRPSSAQFNLCMTTSSNVFPSEQEQVHERPVPAPLFVSQGGRG